MRHKSWFVALCIGMLSIAHAATPTPAASASYYVTLEKDGQLIAEQEVRAQWGQSPASELRNLRSAPLPIKCVTDGAPFVADRVQEGETVRLLATPDGTRLGVRFTAATVRHAAALCGRDKQGPEVDELNWSMGNLELNKAYTIAAPEYVDNHTMVPHTYVLTVFDTHPTVIVHPPIQVADRHGAHQG